MAAEDPHPTPVPAPGGHDLSVLAAFAALLLAFVALTWAKWPLITADSARELYVPFQIRHGAVIYRDFYYLYGPVAPYLQAGLLATFGERLEVLYAASVVQVAAIMGLLYVAARQVLPVFPAAAVLFLFFTHFALGRDIQGYLWPYAFAATYGVLFGLASLVALLRHAATGRAAWLAAAGVTVGLSVVTKLEYGAAAACLAGAYLAGRLLFRRGLAATGPWWGEALALALPAAATAGAIAALLLAHVDRQAVLESTWPTRLMAMWSSRGQWHGDLASWQANGQMFALAFGALALAAGHRRLLDGLRRSWGVRAGVAAAVAAIAALAMARADRLPYLWESAHRFWVGPSFVVLLGVLAVVAWRLADALRGGRPIPPGLVAWGLIAGYGVLVAVRTLFRGLNDYTPYQAPVALIAWVALATAWLPAVLGTPTSRRATHLLLAGLALGLGARHAGDAVATYGPPHVPVSGPAGAVLAPAPVGQPFNAALAFVRQHLRPGEAVVAAPMEPSFYLFLGRDNPVKEDQLFYGYLITPAEQEDFIARMRSANVRYFVLSSYGYAGKRFGVDYMQTLGAWLQDACLPVATFGDAGPYGLTVYETPFAARVGMPAKPTPR